jgi:hypothetical protein
MKKVNMSYPPFYFYTCNLVRTQIIYHRITSDDSEYYITISQ